MKDFLGKKLEVGDDVVYILSDYRELAKAKIVGFTAKTVQLDTGDNKKMSNDRKHQNRFPQDIVKV